MKYPPRTRHRRYRSRRDKRRKWLLRRLNELTLNKIASLIDLLFQPDPILGTGYWHKSLVGRLPVDVNITEKLDWTGE